MNKQVQKALIVFGVAGLLFWVLRPGTDRKPKSSKEGDAAQQKKDAIVVANAYGKAKAAGETAAGLEEVNKFSEQKYGLRVFQKKSDNNFYVLDTKGNEVLKIT